MGGGGGEGEIFFSVDITGQHFIPKLQILALEVFSPNQNTFSNV